MQDNLLVGIWSADCIYGPGAQSDTILVLLPDGTGVLEDWNFVLCEYTAFTWRVGADDLLTLKGTTTTTQDAAGQVVSEPPLWLHEEQFLFSVAEESVPNGGIAEVLTLVSDTSNAPGRLPLIPEKYGRFLEGRFSQDGSDYQLPTFYRSETK